MHNSMLIGSETYPWARLSASPPVVCWSVDRRLSVCVLKGWKVSLPFYYRSTCFICFSSLLDPLIQNLHNWLSPLYHCTFYILFRIPRWPGRHFPALRLLLAAAQHVRGGPLPLPARAHHLLGRQQPPRLNCQEEQVDSAGLISVLWSS